MKAKELAKMQQKMHALARHTPAYNVRDYLRQIVQDALRNNTYTEFDIILNHDKEDLKSLGYSVELENVRDDFNKIRTTYRVRWGA